MRPSGADVGLLGTSLTFIDVTAARRHQRDLEHSSRELETALEELLSTNEELEATNVELQSTTEELVDRELRVVRPASPARATISRSRFENRRGRAIGCRVALSALAGPARDVHGIVLLMEEDSTSSHASGRR